MGRAAVVELASGASVGVCWGVAALLLAVSDTLSSRFGALTVRGELSGCARAASGHVYFTLKDADGAPGLIRCAMFRRTASLLDFAPADGQRVEIRGRLAVYEARGELQFVVEAMQRVGSGTLYEEFLRLRARLQAQGLFDEGRRRRIAAHPRVVGVITSLGAAALRDVLTTLARRAPQVRAVVYPTLVQGAEAPAALVAALALAAARREADTLLLVRGGGSLEDLWAFNDERVVRAVAASPIPVVCGVGHETDFTLCDLAADLRAPTPTAAAELVAPAQRESMTRLAVIARGLTRAMGHALDRHSQRVDLLAQRAGKPAAVLVSQRHGLSVLEQRMGAVVTLRLRLGRQALPGLGQRLQRAGRQTLARRGERLQELRARLQGLHPQQVLQRGYAWIQGEQGRPIMSASALSPAQRIEAVLSDGRVAATVDEVRLGPPPV